MSGVRLIVFAFFMSFCTSAFVSAFIILLTFNGNSFFFPWFERLLIAWPTVFFCIIFFAPIINKFVGKIFSK